MSAQVAGTTTTPRRAGENAASTTKKSGAAAASAVPWTSKYRPAKLAQVRCQSIAVETLKQSLLQGNLPHLLLHGPPGTGKTSLCMALINELYPQQPGESIAAWHERRKDSVLELNASDERGIDTVRSKIKEFAKLAPVLFSEPAPAVASLTTSIHVVGSSLTTKPKIIVLDEADHMTLAAQSALRRIIEEYSATTRFCIICNVVTRILPAVASRCCKFRFRPIPDDVMLERLVAICDREKLAISRPLSTLASIQDEKEETGSSALRAIVRVAAGDMRKAITCLQSVALLYVEDKSHAATAATTVTTATTTVTTATTTVTTATTAATAATTAVVVTDSDVYDAVGDVPPSITDTLLLVCLQGSFDAVQRQVEAVFHAAYNVNLVLERLCASIAESALMDDLQKADAMCKVARVDEILKRQGADGYVQLLDTATFIWDAARAIAEEEMAAEEVGGRDGSDGKSATAAASAKKEPASVKKATASNSKKMSSKK